MEGDKMIEAFKKALESLTPEDIEKYFPEEEPIPIGWISIEEHLPMVTIGDIEKNNGIFKRVMVRDTDGNEYESIVCDHNIWYYEAKEKRITHWFNAEEHD